MEKFEHEFKDHLEIAAKGEKLKAETFHLPAPSNYVIGHVTVLDQEFSKAMLKIAEQEGAGAEEKENADVAASEIILMMSAGGSNLSACYSAMEKIIIKQGKINSEYPVNKVIFDKMSYRDTKEILGGYIKDFLYSSLVD